MATNFLWFAGTANNGLLTAVFTTVTTELQSLGVASTGSTSVNGASGIFNNGASFSAQGIYADAFLNLGSPAATSAFTAGANLACWFLTSADGTTFETSIASTRGPDFVFPMFAATSNATSVFKAVGGGPNSCVVVPALNYKIAFQNNAGVAFNTGSTAAPWMRFAPFAEQY